MTPGPAGRLGLPTLAAYGALALPLAALNLPLYVYLPTFYAAVLGIPLATVGTILLVARLLDMAVDPVLGELADRLRTPLGQRRPLLLAAAPVVLFATWMLFVPAQGVGAGYLLVWSIVAYLSWTVMLLAYAAWGAELTGAYHERSRVSGAREACVILGIVTAAALPAVLGVEPGSATALSALFWLTLVALPPALLLLLALVPEPPPPPQPPLDLRAGIAAALSNRPFVRLLVAYLLNSLANGLPATLFLLYVEHVLGAASAAGLLLLVYFGAGMLSVPVWLQVSYRFGKSRTWAVSMLWACVVFAAVLFLGQGDVVAFAVICVLSGFSLGADLALPASMQADVVDLDRVATGRRRTGLFFAVWGMATKLAGAVAVGIAFPVLAAIGFTTAGGNDGTALTGLALLYGGLPVVLKLAAVALVWRFPLDESAQAELQRRLQAAS
ncbi:MAG: MFS transporter [Geminicoccaceae bacterium]